MTPKFFPIVLSIACFFSAHFSSTLHAADLVIPEGVIFERGIEYANPDGQHLQLNIARPKDAKGPLPVILCIHGGGFRAGSREGYNSRCIKLAQHGFVAATASYRFAPNYKFPAQVYDVKAAVRWLRANAEKYQIDPNRFGVTGGSAGGHLAQFLGVTIGVADFEGDEGNPGFSSAVTCVVNEFGPSDFTKSYGKSVDAAEVLPLFLGGNLATAMKQHIRSCPLNWVTPKAAPTLLLHGTEDQYVAFEQAEWMRDRLQNCGVPVQLMSFQGAKHGFGGADAVKAEKAMIGFFEEELKPNDNSK